MANKIQLRRGTKAKLPTSLAVGEPAYTTDTHELFVGSSGGNVNMSGTKQYLGTALSGTTTTTNYHSYSSCPTVKVGDTYLNTSNGNLYECTTAGSGSSAKWTYRGCLKGVKGDTGEQGATGAAGANGANGANGKDGAKGERGANATIVIAASNSSAKSKAAADYTCSGSGNQSTITTALGALPSTGGKIVFLEGTYSISSAITISKNVIFEGMGDGTQFNVSGALATCSAAVNVVLRDMKITANTISTYLYKGGGSDNVLLDNVTLTMTATGVHNLTTTDTYAAFISVNSFIADKSRISLTTSCTGGMSACFSIADYSAVFESKTHYSHPVNLTNCKIKLNASNGNAHISRGGCQLSCGKLHLNSTKDKGTASVSYDDWHPKGCSTVLECTVFLEGTHNVYGAFGTVVGSTFLKTGTASSVTLTINVAIGCDYDPSIQIKSSNTLGNASN